MLNPLEIPHRPETWHALAHLQAIAHPDPSDPSFLSSFSLFLHLLRILILQGSERHFLHPYDSIQGSFLCLHITLHMEYILGHLNYLVMYLNSVFGWITWGQGMIHVYKGNEHHHTRNGEAAIIILLHNQEGEEKH